jgi:competence protein ComEC
VLLAAAARSPDILADGEARLFAVNSPEGRLLVSSRAAARFEREIWLRRIGFQPDQEQSWSAAADGIEAPRCDSAGCIAHVRGEIVAFTTDRAGLADDCRVATVIVSAVPVPRRRCPSAHTVIDRFDLWRGGTHAIWLEGGHARIESVNGVRGDRPWVVGPRQNRSPRPPVSSEPDDEGFEEDMPPEAADGGNGVP